MKAAPTRGKEELPRKMLLTGGAPNDVDDGGSSKEFYLKVCYHTRTTELML